MKKISLILTLFVCFLIVHPIVKSVCNFSENIPIQVCSNNCCIIAKKDCKKLDNTKKSKKPCCPNGLCNPFENCASCQSIIPEKLVYSLSVLSDEKKPYYARNEFAKSEYLFSIFQPPEFENKIA